MPLSLISWLVHGYIALRLVPALADFGAWQVFVAALIAISAVCLQLGLSSWQRRRQQQSRSSEIAMGAGLIAMGFLSSLFVLTLLRDVALLVAWISIELGAAIPLSVLSGWSALTVAVAATLMTMLGLINARRTA